MKKIKCDHCKQEYNEDEIKSCEFHLGKSEKCYYCKNCAIFHEKCGEDGFL